MDSEVSLSRRREKGVLFLPPRAAVKQNGGKGCSTKGCSTHVTKYT